jgi:N-dimethylarginine dimethylaminohydrolase
MKPFGNTGNRGWNFTRPARIALTRPVSEAFERCELTHRRREPIDLKLARAQHRVYEECLAGLGCRVISLPAEPDLPDSVFIEDTAVVLPEAAVIARPGAESRKPETAAVGGTVVIPANFPATRTRLESLGLRIKAVDMSELQKAEGAVTCCSLVFDA